MHVRKIAATALVLGVCTNAQAGCHAKNFDIDKMHTAVNEVNAAAANLKALLDTPGLRSDDNLLLAISAQVTDRSATETALFIGYIIIYGRLTNNEDRSATDDFIADVASTSVSSLKGFADYLTVIASAPRFGTEIRAARDSVRKLETLFACAR